MAKKIWYSSPLNLYWNELYPTQKKITPHLTDEQIYSGFKYTFINKPLEEGESSENRELLLTGLEMWKEDYTRELLHIFFQEKQLKEFLEKIPLSDLSGIKTYLYQTGKNKKVIYIKAGSQKNCVVYSFGLHIPYETDGYAFSFNIYEDKTLELFFTHGKQQGGLTDKFYPDLLKENDAKSITLAKIFRLAINTIAYMKCFPECVVDGVPKITIDRNEKRTENNITFEISEKVAELETSGKSIIPHFRKGYFKLLSSDFYTHKKGQLIFVNETMVKGKAKTVYTSDKINSIKSFDEK